MGFISWIIFGLIAGGIAKFLMPGKQGGGLIKTVLLGVIGSLVGGWIGTQLGFGTVEAGFDIRNFGLAVVGALVVLFIWQTLFGSKE